MRMIFTLICKLSGFNGTFAGQDNSAKAEAHQALSKPVADKSPESRAR
jgi:hypothetical protein